MQNQIVEHLNSPTLIVQHKTVLHYHSATLNSAIMNSANSKGATSNAQTLKQCNINGEIPNTIT